MTRWLSTFPRMPLLVIAALVAFFPASTARATSAQPNGLSQLNAAFDDAVARLPRDPVPAKAALARIAADYASIAERNTLTDYSRARILYNSGLAYQLADQMGPAILAYRRAEALNPLTPGLSSNLPAARLAVTAQPDKPASQTKTSDSPRPSMSLDTALSFVRAIPRVWLWRTALIAFAAAWLLAVVRILARNALVHPPLTLIAAAILVAILPAAALIYQQVLLATNRYAVVISDAAPRTGPDDLTSDPAPIGTLKAGSEVSITDSREGGDGRPWVRVKVRDSEVPLWLPRSAIEPVIPRAAF